MAIGKKCDLPSPFEKLKVFEPEKRAHSPPLAEGQFNPIEVSLEVLRVDERARKGVLKPLLLFS